MRAEIKSIFCPDVPGGDLGKWEPADPGEVYLPLELRIGWLGSEAADLSQVVAATPRAINGRQERRRCKLLVVPRYEWRQVWAMLEEWVAECERPDWGQAVECLRRRFEWEYEGMGPR